MMRHWFAPVRWWEFRGWLASKIAPSYVFINQDSKFIGASHWGNLKIVQLDDWEPREGEDGNAS